MGDIQGDLTGEGSLQIRLLSHASVAITTAAGSILTDPWFRSRAFNDSWALLGEAAVDDEILDSIDWIWVSHEHPDHFNVPTLRGLPDRVKERVTVLFQDNNSNKVEEAFHAFGFPKVQRLPHRELVTLAPGLRVSCYQVGQMDSTLFVEVEGGPSLLNVNDAEINSRDCEAIVADLGRPDVVLNQFSVAGYGGMPEPERHIPEHGRKILDNVAANHRDLGATTTIPIASYVYFCAPDNAYVNAHVNTPGDVVQRLAADGAAVKVLAPGETWTAGEPIDNRHGLEYWTRTFATIDDLPLTEPPTVEEAELRRAFQTCCDRLHEHFPRPILRAVSPVVVDVPDLGRTFSLSFVDRTMTTVDGGADVEVNSQPLDFMLSQPFGLQTLGVSARYRLTGPSARWKRLRILMSMENAELYLRPRHLVSPDFLRFVAARARGGVNQLRYQLARM